MMLLEAFFLESKGTTTVSIAVGRNMYYRAQDEQRWESCGGRAPLNSPASPRRIPRACGRGCRGECRGRHGIRPLSGKSAMQIDIQGGEGFPTYVRRRSWYTYPRFCCCAPFPRLVEDLLRRDVAGCRPIFPYRPIVCRQSASIVLSTAHLFLSGGTSYHFVGSLLLLGGFVPAL